MIDFNNELKKYSLFKMDDNINSLFSETKLIFDIITSTLKRFAKEQNHTNMQVEEIVCMLDEQKENDCLVDELKKSLSKANEVSIGLVKGIIKVMDQFEDLYRFSTKSQTTGWSDQIKLLWENISGSLLSMGITRIDGERTNYNAEINNVVSTKTIENLPDGIIVEVLKSGYIYKSEVIRRSQVIVNKIS